MTGPDLLVLLPLLIVAGTAVLVLVGIAVRRHHGLTVWLSLAGLVAAAAALGPAAGRIPRQVTPLLQVDAYGLLFWGLLLAASAAVVGLAYAYLERQAVPREELYVLLLSGTLGAMVLAASRHFASLVLGLEILSVSIYASSAYLRSRERSVEAGLKYLILASASGAFLLFGVALLYAGSGTLDFSRLVAGGVPGGLGIAGAILVLVGIGFKLALVPFHMWAADVYQGAPAPVSAFIATVSKAGIFALLLRYGYGSGLLEVPAVVLVLGGVAVACMVAGNLLALLQQNVKRILAYSSIAHMGYALVAFLAAGALATRAVTVYLVAYGLALLGAFGILTMLSTADREPERLEDLRGLASRHPWLAGAFTTMVFSLAGIPLTGGFLGKFYVLASGVTAARWGLVLTLVVTSTAGLYYYLRIVATLYDEPAAEGSVLAAPAWSSGAILLVLTILLIWLGVYPAAALDVIRLATAGIR
ncbi:MAG: NADH-quinone oxidoreductase subunit N [Acidobacteriota bacterium]